MTSNPMMRQGVYDGAYAAGEPMTVSGTANKTMALLMVTVLTACYTWYLAMSGYADKMMMFLIVGSIGGLILAITAAFRPQNSKILSIGYSACEGLVLGGISAVFEQMYPGIVVQAVTITFFAMFAMLGLFKANIIRATDKFRATILGATISIAIFYLIAFVLGLFGNQVLNNVIASNSSLGIALSIIISIIACLNFIIDFEFIEQGEKQGAPKYMEWYGALSLLITLVWLYIEILRLLAKLNSRRN